MHLATYSKSDAGRMLAHYDRSIGERDHIDRDGVVYNLAPEYEGGVQARFRTLCAGLEIGARTKPLADWVITKPTGYHGDTRAFFESVYAFMVGKVGEERIVCAYVHLDEPGAEPHMHFAFVPVVESAVMTNDKSHPLRWSRKDEEKNSAHKAGEVKRDSKGTVRYRRVPLLGEDGRPVVRRTATASKLFTKGDMAEIHPAIEKHLCAALGVERVGMLLDEKDEEQRARRTLSKLGHEDYVRVTKEIERAGREVAELSERSECLRQEVEELEPIAVSFGESVRTLYETRGDGEREEALAGEIGGLRERISELDGANRRARERVAELDRGLPGLRGRHRQLAQRLENLERRMTAVLQSLREVPNILCARALGIAEKLGKRIYDPRSLDRVNNETRAASREYNADRAALGEVPRQKTEHR